MADICSQMSRGLRLQVQVHANQGHIQTVLTAKKVPFNIIDIAIDVSKKDEMRELCGNETAVAPQMFNGTTYLGDYAEFQSAVEQDRLASFLKLSLNSPSLPPE